VRSVFEDISKRLSSIPPPLLAHRVVFSLVRQRLEETIDHASGVPSLKSMLVGILKKFQVEMVWICQLESLDNLIQSLISYKAKAVHLHQKIVVCNCDCRIKWMMLT
jgi:hypothetical protein